MGGRRGLALARTRLLTGTVFRRGGPSSPQPSPASSTGSGFPAVPSRAPTPNGTHFEGSCSRWASVLPRVWISEKPFGSIHIRSPSSRPSTPDWPGSGRSCWQYAHAAESCRSYVSGSSYVVM